MAKDAAPVQQEFQHPEEDRKEEKIKNKKTFTYRIWQLTFLLKEEDSK